MRDSLKVFLRYFFKKIWSIFWEVFYKFFVRIFYVRFSFNFVFEIFWYQNSYVDHRDHCRDGTTLIQKSDATTITLTFGASQGWLLSRLKVLNPSTKVHHHTEVSRICVYLNVREKIMTQVYCLSQNSAHIFPHFLHFYWEKGWQEQIECWLVVR